MFRSFVCLCRICVICLFRELGEVEYLVLDEADQMLAVGFEEAVESILENLPQKRQSMLFSATMPTWVKKLTRKYLDNPVFSGEVVKDGKITLEGFTVAARAFADKWKRHNQSFPPWSWVPLINRTLLKEEGYLALEKIIILTSLEQIESTGRGVLVYLRGHEGRGIGLRWSEGIWISHCGKSPSVESYQKGK
ncbi:hypothetical protein F2Q69_00014872 [Brassica cretica]|uniref:Helicase ATP-binding domain-containing protein n=1 Tax=Brassica cretica TaxID=69181 RepID=A0A8S9R3K7_BRACR|nr:hypothetical protein F2Q69_00014872 [Brassica cretica]